MVTVKLSKRKRMRSKIFLKKSVPFLIGSMAVILIGLVVLGRVLEGNRYEGQAQWAWFIVTFLLTQYINLKYIVEK